MNLLWTLGANNDRSRSKVWVAGLLAALALPTMPVATPRAEAAFPGRNGRIAISVLQPPFTSLPNAAYPGEYEGDRDIFTFAPSGGAVTQVTSGPALDHNPAWSPNGRQIAFSRSYPPYPLALPGDIYVVSSDGTGLRNLTNTPDYWEYHPAWSPDGKKIVFSSDRANPDPLLFERHDLYVMDADGSNLVQLTSDSGTERSPAWSPDGLWIAFDDDGAITLVHPDGTRKRVLANNGGTWPSWSPDGTKIAFWSVDESVAYSVNVDRGRLRPLTAEDDSTIGGPAWSPDGRWIAFVSDRDGGWQLYRMRPNGSAIQRITGIDLKSPHVHPDWGPRE